MDSLITAYLSGNASTDDVSRLNEWIYLSAENKQYFRSFCDVWQISGGLAHTESDSHIPALREFLNLTQSKETEGSGKFIKLNVWKYAAGILIILAAGFLAGRISDSTPETGLVNTAAVIFAPMGSKAVGILPDGSEVWLNAGSRIEYNTQTYNLDQRTVSLTGEAYFKVKTNANKPFVVNAKGINVKALGTEFNVKAYPEENEVITTLVKGIVKIEGKDKEQKQFVLEMKPNQIVKLEAPSQTKQDTDITSPKEIAHTPEKQSATIQAPIKNAAVVENNVNTTKYTSWKDNQWMLEGEDIGNLVVMLERKFNVTIDVKSPELTKYKFTGTFRNETLEQVLSVLKIATPMKYKIGKGTVTLEIDPVLKARYQKFISE